MRTRADSRLIRIVLENLIENGFKLVAPEPAPEVEVRKGGNGPIFVRDRGIDSDTAYLPKVFQPFERLVHGTEYPGDGVPRDGVPRTEYPGTGIGLPRVKRIVERRGGRIDAFSEPGRGATFTFWMEPGGSATGRGSGTR
jgi:signal transduction histidine kinase